MRSYYSLSSMSKTEDWVESYQKSAKVDKEKEIEQLSEKMREDDLLFRSVNKYAKSAKKED